MSSLQIAAQCWCDERTAGRQMDPELAVVFAEHLDVAKSIPRLGLATTQELLAELEARAAVDCKPNLAEMFAKVQTYYTCAELRYKTHDPERA